MGIGYKTTPHTVTITLTDDGGVQRDFYFNGQGKNPGSVSQTTDRWATSSLIAKKTGDFLSYNTLVDWDELGQTSYISLACPTLGPDKVYIKCMTFFDRLKASVSITTDFNAWGGDYRYLDDGKVYGGIFANFVVAVQYTNDRGAALPFFDVSVFHNQP